MQTYSADHLRIISRGLHSLLIISILFFQSGCERCSSHLPVATLKLRAGVVDRDHAPSVERWSEAKLGDSFTMGDAVRTGRGASAELFLDDGSLLGLDEETLIRFLDRKPGKKEQSLDLQLGAATLEAPSGGTTVRTKFGLAQLEGGAKVQLRRNGGTLRYEVLLGNAKLESMVGNTAHVAAGEYVEISLGQATIEVSQLPPEDTDEQPGELEPTEPVEAIGPVSAQVHGPSVMQRSPTSSKFSQISAGEALIVPGSILRVGKGSSVVLQRDGDSAKLTAGGTYLVGGAQLVSAQEGTMTINTADTITIEVPGGQIVTRRGSATIRSTQDGSHIQANSGIVVVKGGSTEELFAGEEAELATDGKVTLEGRGLAGADLNLNVGRNIVVHDPTPPTAVRFLFGDSCERGVVHLKASAKTLVGPPLGRGRNQVALAMGQGTTSYVLRCLDEHGKESAVQSRGKITVLRDAGSREMPRRAPVTSIEVNGRSYSVLYQHQLPKITLRWPNAPSDVGSFQLHAQGGGRSRTFSSSAPTYTFRSGALRSGAHTFYFTGGGRVSRRSTIKIHFDNATPTASLSVPVDTGVAPGGSLPIAGSVLPGWSAIVAGEELKQNANHQFKGTASMPSDGRALLLRLRHPTRGEHIYLRRPAGAR